MKQQNGASRAAILGGGPGGIVAAKYLREHGFDPIVFEQSDNIGGQWNGRAPHSGVWDSMPTNTSRVMTRFSDLAHDSDVAVYPTERQMLGYLQQYAARFGVLPGVRLRTPVQQIERAPSGDGWVVRYATDGGPARTETFPYVVVATGRYNKPEIPPAPGLDSFSGADGVSHTFDFKDPDRFRGRRVLVAGCSISALEIASALAMRGAARVVSTFRRQRYVVPKLLAGVPTDHVVFTRFAALSEEALPPAVLAGGMREFVLRGCGSPDQFGGFTPADDLFAAGITQSQHYLPLVAEGRITPRPWIDSVSGETVRFQDGSEEPFDAIIFGTGYALNLPFLSEEIRRTLDLDDHHLDLHHFTFHPDLPNLAFLGLYSQIGPYFPTLELQARWLTYVWAGQRPAPAREEMEAGIAACRARRGQPQDVMMHSMALLFARAAGVEPELHERPELARALLFGPLSPTSFRLSGPDRLPDAPERCIADAAAFGAIPSPTFAPDQSARFAAVAGMHKDPAFAHFARSMEEM